MFLVFSQACSTWPYVNHQNVSKPAGVLVRWCEAVPMTSSQPEKPWLQFPPLRLCCITSVAIYARHGFIPVLARGKWAQCKEVYWMVGVSGPGGLSKLFFCNLVMLRMISPLKELLL